MPPPAAPDHENRLRRAALLNFLLPGAGQWLIGQRKLGVALMSLFFAAFAAALAVFLAGMNAWFALAASPNILEGDNLENLSGAFHLPWLVVLSLVAVLDFAVSLLLLWAKPPPRH